MTPEWRVDEWDLRADFAKIEQQWGLLRSLLTDPELFRTRDERVSAWSCGEHAGHLALVTQWIATEIENNLREPTRGEHGGWNEDAEEVLRSGEIPRGAWQTPPPVWPEDRSAEEYLTHLSGAEESWRDLTERSQAIGECPARFQHFMLGYLTSADWVRFCAIHTAHHLRIVRDIRER